MKHSGLFIILLLIMTGSALAEPVLVDDTTQKFDTMVPSEPSQAPPTVPAVAPVVTPAVPAEVPQGDKALTPVETRQGEGKQEERNRGRDRNGPDRNKPGRPNDKDDNGKKPHGPSHGKPHRPPPRVVYVYPHNYRVINRTEIYTYPSQAETTTVYQNGYFPPYKLGDYLPDNRQWFKLPEYAAYGLSKPKIGEEWVFNGNEVILLSTSTGQILSAITLAAPIQ